MLKIPVGPAVDETLTQPTSVMGQQIEVLNLLEKKLIALMELVKATTTNSTATPPAMHKSIEASVSQDLLYSQVDIALSQQQYHHLNSFAYFTVKSLYFFFIKR